MLNLKNLNRLVSSFQNQALNSWLPLGAILVAAFILRWLFAAGISNEIDLIHLDRAAQTVTYLRQIPQGLFTSIQQARIQMGGSSDLFLYAPNLLAYFAFGTAVWTSILPSILVSLANIVLIFGFSKLLQKSNAASLIAVLFWAFLPLDIFYSTTSPRIEFLIFWSLLAIWMFRSWERSKGKIWQVGVLLIICLVIILVEPWAIVAPAIFMIYMGLSMRANGQRILLALGVAIAFLLALKWMEVGKTFLDFYNLILTQPESVFLLPLFLVAATVCLLTRPRMGQPYLALATAALVAYFIHKLFAEPSAEVNLFTTGIFLSLFLIAFSILLGDYFSKGIRRQSIAIPIALITIFSTLSAVAAVAGSNRFFPPFDHLEWVGLHSLFLIFSILSGVALLGALLSPYLVMNSTENWKVSARFALLAVIFLATLPHSWNRRNEHKYLIQAPAEALSYLSEQNIQLPIYVTNDETFRMVSLLSKMDNVSENFKENGVRLDEIRAERASQIEEGLILGLENELDSPPPTWLRLGAFGPLGKPRVAVYRVLSQKSAQQISVRVDKSTDEAYGALINLGSFCEAYVAWAKPSQTDIEKLNFIPYNPVSNCILRRSNLVELDDLIKPENIQGYITFPDLPQPAEELTQLDMRQISLPIYDKRTSRVEVLLQPNTLYLYSIEVKSPSPIATLYWSVDGQENYLEMKTYKEWSLVSILILTPNWATAKLVSFSPVIFDHLDTVSIRNFFIGPVELYKN